MKIIKFIVSLLSHALSEALLRISLFHKGLVDELYSLDSDRDPIDYDIFYSLGFTCWFVYEFNAEVEYLLVVSFEEIVLLYLYLQELLVVNVDLDLIVEELNLGAAVLDELEHYSMKLFGNSYVFFMVYVI